MIILAFESSCDETSVAVVERKRGGFCVRSNIVASQIATHRLYGGVVPEIASRAHIEAISQITYEALEKAGVELSEIDLVAVTANPGLIGALLVGVNYAKAIAIANGIPLVGVDHIKGHVAASYLCSDKEAPKPPFIAFAASGGHTSIYLVTGYTDYTEIGSTRDDAIGESYDKIGRIIGIPYPAGRGFDELSTEGFINATSDKERFYEKYKKSSAFSDFNLPSPALHDGSLDFSFSGLKTAAINLLHKYEMRGEEIDRAAFAAKYTYEATEAVVRQLSLALERYPDMPLVAAGGVTANSHLRRELCALAKRCSVNLYIPKIEYCGDNAAMIAAQGYYDYKSGVTHDSSLNASAEDSITR